MADLFIPVKGIYFDQIKAGTKPFEFRLRNEYWRKRLEGRDYFHVIFTRGYPKRDDLDKHHICRYRGYELQTIKHEHFGQEPVEVYAIRAN